MDPYLEGDPFIEWGELNAADQVYPGYENHEVEEKAEEKVMGIQELKDEVIKLLQTRHDFTIEDAESAVADSYDEETGLWNENAEAESLAKYLASDGDND